MKQKRKIGTARAVEQTLHPEKQASVRRGLPDSDSSKANDGEQPDARTGHDRDGNEDQSARKGVARANP
jgi:hypothetical protein